MESLDFKMFGPEQNGKKENRQNRQTEIFYLSGNGSFLFVSLIGIRLGRVSYHDQVQVQGFKGKKGERSWKRLFWGFWGEGRGYQGQGFCNVS